MHTQYLEAPIGPQFWRTICCDSVTQLAFRDKLKMGFRHNNYIRSYLCLDVVRTFVADLSRRSRIGGRIKFRRCVGVEASCE
jgi:hypothetical protein